MVRRRKVSGRWINRMRSIIIKRGPGGSYRSTMGRLFFKTNDMVQAVEAPDSIRNKVSFSIFGFLDREVSLKVQSLVYFMEGRLMLLSSKFSCSNIKYKVQLSSGEYYPVPEKSTPVYITNGDGGNQEGLVGRYGCVLLNLKQSEMKKTEEASFE
ncbi:hypothetical protein PVK06_019446 [Gossypium arboreum]|uniref:Uncharacterized protein n=1 Tax=Gossypium arboreum TaxID=29729 RepID=A0ABR0PK18_GOSAR|nr:hypothetical protein PVK06_019446 [Gossypium arboreum]